MTFSVNQCNIICIFFLVFKWFTPTQFLKYDCAFAYSSLIIDSRMIIGISDESVWHSLHTDVTFNFYFFIYRPKFPNILLVMLPKCLLFLCYRQLNNNWHIIEIFLRTYLKHFRTNFRQKVICWKSTYTSFSIFISVLHWQIWKQNALNKICLHTIS